MSWPYAQILTAVTGNVLAASDWNSEQQNHINNNIPASIDDDSPNVAGMQTTVDPGGVGTESLPTDLKGEIERLRYVFTKIHGGAQWYAYPATNALLKGGGTMSGAIAMGSNKITGLAAASANGDAVRFEQINGLRILQIQQGTSSTSFSTASSTPATTNLTVTITPASVSSTILVMAFGDLQSSSTTTILKAALFRGNTNISPNSIGAAALFISAGSQAVPASMCTFDSPATNAATTYTVKLSSSNNSSAVTWGSIAGQSIIAVEIG